MAWNSSSLYNTEQLLSVCVCVCVCVFVCACLLSRELMVVFFLSSSSLAVL